VMMRDAAEASNRWPLMSGGCKPSGMGGSFLKPGEEAHWWFCMEPPGKDHGTSRRCHFLAVPAVKRAVSFKADVDGGRHGDEAGGGGHKKPHTSIVVDRNATMSGYCKRSASNITIKVGS